MEVNKLLALFVQFCIAQCSTGEGKMGVQAGCEGVDVDSHSYSDGVGAGGTYVNIYVSNKLFFLTIHFSALNIH